MGKLSYTQFLWKSQNLHGLHSPFVFGFVSNYIYARGLRLTRNEYRAAQTGMPYPKVELLHRIIANSRSKKLFVLGDETHEITEALRKLGEMHSLQLWFFSPLAPIPGGADFAYISGRNTDELLPLFEQALPNLSSNAILAIGNIHTTEATAKAWETIKNDPKVTVTVDLYHFGLVFFRQGQAKQHFSIRTTTSKLTDAFLGIKNLWGLLG